MTRLLKENIPAITNELLKFNKVPVTKWYQQERLQSHPHYPGLVSESEVLKEYKVENHSSFERSG